MKIAHFLIFLSLFMLIVASFVTYGNTENQINLLKHLELKDLYDNYTIYYVSPNSTSTNWSAARNITTPCSIQTAFQDARGGDVVFLLPGKYNLTEPLITRYSGTDTAPVVFRNYTAMPTIHGDGLNALIFVENSYWRFTGIEFEMENLPDHDHALLYVGYNHEAWNITVDNCTFHLISTVGHDNLGAMILQANRSNHALIENNLFLGPGTDDAENYSFGIQYLGGGNTGTRVLHNEFSEFKYGVFVKHANGDNSSTGAEIAYNFVHNCTIGFYGNPVHINYHDNLVLGEGFDFGDNGGGPQGNNCTVNHNTVVNGGIHLRSPGEGPIRDFIIANNIVYHLMLEDYNGDTLSQNYWDYNMYVSGEKIGAHDLGNTEPVFVSYNSTEPSGYELVPDSPGKHGGSDGEDIGANITLVGRLSGKVECTIPMAPQNLTAKDGQGYVNISWHGKMDRPVGFKIYRNGVFYDFVFYSRADGYYNDTDVESNTIYFYSVSSVNIAGEGPRSEEVSSGPEVPEIDCSVVLLIFISILLILGEKEVKK